MKTDVKKINSMMQQYKESGDEGMLQDIFTEMEGIVHNQCGIKFSMYKNNSNLLNMDDFRNLAYQYIWKAMNDYRYICPICGIKAKNKKAFRKHLKHRHGCGTVSERGKKIKYVTAYPNIFTVVTRLLENYLLNVIRDETKQKRVVNKFENRITVNASDNSGEKESDVKDVYDSCGQAEAKNTENIVISKSTIQDMMDKIQKEGKKVHLFVMKGLMKGYSKLELAEILHNKGIYGSVSSAKSTISKITKDLQSYYINVA